MNAKLKHYQTVIRPEALYAAECLTQRTSSAIEKLEVKERRIIRKILGPKFKDGIYKLRSNLEVYSHNERISSVIRKRRILFYAHITRLPTSRLSNRLLLYFESLKTLPPWLIEVNKDLSRFGISKSDIQLRTVKEKLSEAHQEAVVIRKKYIHSDEWRSAHSERMKAWWACKKKENEKLRFRGPRRPQR